MKNFLLVLVVIFSFSNSLGANQTLYLYEVGQSIPYLHVKFEWTQAEDASSYNFQLASSESFSAPIVDLITSSLLYIDTDNINWDELYYYRVADNASGEWSDIKSFSTASKISSATTTILDNNYNDDGLTIFGAYVDFFSAAIDKNGREVWRSAAAQDDYVGGMVYYSTDYFGNWFGLEYQGNQVDNETPGIMFNFKNEISWKDPSQNLSHHEIIQLPNGNYLGLIEDNPKYYPVPDDIGVNSCSYVPWIGDRLVEWNADTNEEVWSWSTFDHFSIEDYDRIGGSNTKCCLENRMDWTHANAFYYDESDNSIYLSSRHLSRITKIDKSTGEVVWNVGVEMPSGDVISNDLEMSFQHSIEVLPNGNILTMDNGNLSKYIRSVEYNGETILCFDYASEADCPTESNGGPCVWSDDIFQGSCTNPDFISRALEFQVIENSNGMYEASKVWEYDLPPEYFGDLSGNVSKLESGNYLITTIGSGGKTFEVDSEGNIVWQASYNLSEGGLGGLVYRANRISSLYPVAFSFLKPIEEGSLSFTLINEGSEEESFIVDFIDLDQNILDSRSINSMSINGIKVIDDIDLSIFAEINSIKVTPMHREDLAKTIFMSYDADLGGTNSIADYPQYSYRISSIYPNPFNSSIKIDVDVPQRGVIDLSLFDLSGKKIKEIFKGNVGLGSYQYNVDFKDYHSGQYFVRMKAENFSESKKVLFVK